MTASAHALELARVAVSAAADKKARDIVVKDVSEAVDYADCMVLTSATNERQVQAVVEAIEDRLRERDVKPRHREGRREGQWWLLTYQDIVVHVQHTEARGFYGLDRLWKDCPTIDFPEAVVLAGGDDTT